MYLGLYHVHVPSTLGIVTLLTCTCTLGTCKVSINKLHTPLYYVNTIAVVSMVSKMQSNNSVDGIVTVHVKVKV